MVFPANIIIYLYIQKNQINNYGLKLLIAVGIGASTADETAQN